MTDLISSVSGLRGTVTVPGDKSISHRAVMLGALFFTMVLTNRADRVRYAKLEGQPGAAIGVLGNISKAGYSFPQEPVWVDPKTKDMIWRGTSNSGIYLLGEGDEQRINRAMDREERKIKGVTAGSSIPVYRICVGTGEHQVRLKDVRRAVLKCKSYEPTHHKLWIAKKLHPRSRFYLTKTELKTIQIGLRMFISQYSAEYGLIMAASVVALIPVLIVFLSLQKYFVQGVASAGLKG